jgi:hypothetical protein
VAAAPKPTSPADPTSASWRTTLPGVRRTSVFSQRSAAPKLRRAMTTKPAIALLLSIAAMLLTASGTCAAEEPVATAPIPPLPAAAPSAVVIKPFCPATTRHTAVVPSKRALKRTQPASRERASADRRRLTANGEPLPPPPDYPTRHYYRGGIVPGPEGPPLPFPWYGPGPSFAGMPVRGPGGPPPPRW